MSTRSSLDRLVSEEVFCKAVIGLLVGMPVVELFTEFLCRFNDMIIPSFFQPQILALFGMFGTVLTVLYWIASVPSKRKLRMADIFYLTLLFFMIISAVFSLNPGVYSYGMMFYCENPLHFLAYYWLYFAGTLIDNVKYRIRILYAYLIVAVLEVTVAFLHTFDIEIIPCTTYRAPHAAYGLAVLPVLRVCSSSRRVSSSRKSRDAFCSRSHHLLSIRYSPAGQGLPGSVWQDLLLFTLYPFVSCTEKLKTRMY